MTSLGRSSVFQVALLALACNPSSSSRTVDGAGSAPAVVSPTPSAANVAPTSAPSSGRPKIVVASEDSDALTLIRTKRLEAKAEGRVLVVYVSATWCEPCRRMKRELDSGRLDDRLAKITFLAFDADKDMDRLVAAGYSFKFVPFVALPAVAGEPAESQQATGKGGEAWRELLAKLDAWQR